MTGCTELDYEVAALLTSVFKGIAYGTAVSMLLLISWFVCLYWYELKHFFKQLWRKLRGT